MPCHTLKIINNKIPSRDSCATVSEVNKNRTYKNKAIIWPNFSE